MSREKQIEEMADEIMTVVMRNRNMLGVAETLYNKGYRKQSEWISVEERLPEDVYGKDRKQITVLVHTKSGRISSASRMRIVKWDKTKLEWVELDTFEWSRGLRVTHWMPLPEAPKGGGE